MVEKKRSEHDALDLERIPQTPASELPSGTPVAPPSASEQPSASTPPRLEGFDPSFWDLIVA